MNMSELRTPMRVDSANQDGMQVGSVFGHKSSAGSLGMSRMASERVMNSLSSQNYSGSRGQNSIAVKSRVLSRVTGRVCGLIMDDHEGRIMHRMRQSLIFSLIGFMVATSGIARGALIQPNTERKYPDIAADVSGVVNYNYSNGQGTFTMRNTCLLYTSPSPRDRQKSRMPSSA